MVSDYACSVAGLQAAYKIGMFNSRMDGDSNMVSSICWSLRLDSAVLEKVLADEKANNEVLARQQVTTTTKTSTRRKDSHSEAIVPGCNAPIPLGLMLQHACLISAYTGIRSQASQQLWTYAMHTVIECLNSTSQLWYL